MTPCLVGPKVKAGAYEAEQGPLRSLFVFVTPLPMNHLETKAAWFFGPWPESDVPTSLREWAVKYGWRYHWSDDPKLVAVEDHQRAVDWAIYEAQRLADLLRTEFYGGPPLELDR